MPQPGPAENYAEPDPSRQLDFAMGRCDVYGNYLPLLEREARYLPTAGPSGPRLESDTEAAFEAEL